MNGMKQRDPGRGRGTGEPSRELARLIAELDVLREAMLEAELRLTPPRRPVPEGGVASARNLAHFLALRSFDLRDVQERLANLGLSSLGRAEPHVLASVDKVLDLLRLMAGAPPATGSQAFDELPTRHLLERRSEALFGPAPQDHRARIMVTLPSEAASDEALVQALVGGGMDVARINCAHDDADAWIEMAAKVRRAAAGQGRAVRVLMDLGGPKLRTGPIASPPPVLKLKPERDPVGAVVTPLRLGLRAVGSSVVVAGAKDHVGVDPAWLAALKVADQIDLVDARSSARRLAVLNRGEDWALVEGLRTVYLTPQTRLRLMSRDGPPRETILSDLPLSPGRLLLHLGDRLRLVRQGLGHDAGHGSSSRRLAVATVACTLPEALDALRPGERVWFDDGRIGGVVRRTSAKWTEVEITAAAEEGSWLGADKGINLPDTRLDLPALTAKDIEDLGTVSRHTDLVGLSFAQDAADVKLLRRHLRRLASRNLGIVLKVETRRGFEHLPDMLLAALGSPAAGVMIARGDLAVECGFERLAEVQEEILWACEAAHVPVIWATQVLESEAKSGLPSRAEITDAAMGSRAECVMLNKGPHILEAMRSLDDILRRMRSLQSKKRPLLRALTAWNSLAATAEAPAWPPSPRSDAEANAIAG
jgi:pyruvate kinase